MMYLLPTEVPTLDFQVKVAITDFSYSLGPQEAQKDHPGNYSQSPS